MNRKTVRKWQKVKHEKPLTRQSLTALSFKTHNKSDSEAQILIPKQYKHISQKDEFLLIESANNKILVQVSSSSFIQTGLKQQNDEQNVISILSVLAEIAGVISGKDGKFMGQIRSFNVQKDLSQFHLLYVELHIKEIYFSRRDQYKVQKALTQRLTHVYGKKNLTFQATRVEVASMMLNDQQQCRSGIIDKNTRIIYRSCCAKSTILIQICRQTFQLNGNKQLYLYKIIQFLTIYLHRNKYFNNKHRVDLILFGRLFYPQFHTLKQVYQYLLKDISSVQEQKYYINMASALQKDQHNRIYQDVYRKIIWQQTSIDQFQQFFWEKISEFMYTINWHYYCTNYAKFISDSMKNNTSNLDDKNYSNNGFHQKKNIKPFLLRIKSQLAQSSQCNVFQAISLISQQYKHHYKFRSLKETGNSIVILTVGTSKYHTDETTYKMAKSYIYLTNISCIMVNLSTKVDQVQVEVDYLSKKSIYKNQKDCKKITNLIYWCIEQSVYLSPMEYSMKFREYFETKSMIFPQNLSQINNLSHKNFGFQSQHQCDKKNHYYLCENEQIQIQYESKNKNVEWINSYYMNDQSFKVHEYFYGVFDTKFQFNSNQTHRIICQSQKQIFQENLNCIIWKKKEWFELIPSKQSNIQKKINNYLNFISRQETNAPYFDDNKLKQLDKKLFLLQVVSDNDYNNNNFQTSSITDHIVKQQRNFNSSKKTRKSYEKPYYDMFPNRQAEDSLTFDKDKPKINIFQATLNSKNHEYIKTDLAHEKKDKKKNKATHNKERLKNNFINANIHYLMPTFNEQILNKLKNFLNKRLIKEQQKINRNFEMQKQWKNICFPILTPIDTKYKQKIVEKIQNLASGKIIKDQLTIDDQICQLLMQNFQIEQSPNRIDIIKLSKGHITCQLKKNDLNLSISYVIDKEKQNKIIPFIFYRYLCYQDKDERFCNKFIYFQDKNYYENRTESSQQVKSVRIVMINQNNKKDNIQDFIRVFNEKMKCSIVVVEGSFLQNLGHQFFSKNLCKNQGKNSLYQKQQIKVTIDTKYHYKTLFSIIIEWNYCSAELVTEFIDFIQTIARRSKLNSFIITPENVFETDWNMNTIGEINFHNQLGIQLLQTTINNHNQWFWDNQGYYMNYNGTSFIKIMKNKKLILWKQNNYEKIMKKLDQLNLEYFDFFIKSATYDFVAEIILRTFNNSLQNFNTNNKQQIIILQQ